MTDVQYRQDNERQARYRTDASAASQFAGGGAPVRAMYPTERRFSLVPGAILCAIVVVGIMIYYNYRQVTPEVETVAVATPAAVSVPTSTEKTADAAQPNITVNGQAVSGSDVEIPNGRITTSSDGTNINITINPVAESSKGTTNTVVKTVQAAAPVQTVNYVPAPTYYYPNNYYYDYNDNWGNNKPYTPYLENCGNFDGGNRWNDARVVLPKYERDGKSAVEYEVNVGTSVGNSDTYSHRYEQTDRVVFSVSIDNERDYYVRYRVGFDGQGFGDWSDTFRFRCRRG